MGQVVYQAFGPKTRAVTVRNPDDIISTAADLSLADRLRAAGEAVCNYLEKTQKPLNPKDRARLMRAVAVLRSEPE